MLKKIYLFIPLLTAFLWLGTGRAWGDELTVADKTNKNSYCPFYGNWADAYQRSQVIYLSSELAAMNGKKITGMTFYFSSKPSKAWSGSEYHILLSEVTATSFSGSWNTETTGTEVLSCSSLDGSSGTLTLTFTTPYTYNGGNLLFELQDKGAGAFASATFFGDGNLGNRSAGNYSSSSYESVSATARAFLPKTTFTYEDGAPITCPKPSNLTKGAVTATSAAFTWTAGGEESSWQYVCLPAATAVDWDDATKVKTATSAEATVNGLETNTEYKFYVRAYCDDSDQSTEISKAFKTPCSAYATADLPFEQDFNNLTAGTGLIPDCWSKIANGNYPYIYSSGGVEGSKCLYFSGGTSTTSSIIILPAFEAATNTLVISLAYKNNSEYTYYGQAKIGYMTDPEDASTFVALKPLTQKSAWTEENKFALTDAPADSYIAIQYTGGSYSGTMYLDNIKVALPSSCTDPSDVNAVATSANTATVSWTENGSAASWNLQYSSDNFATYTDKPGITEKPYPLTGLAANTTYKVRVQANCGSEKSDWITSAAFTTPCEAVNGIGWSEDFENATAGSGKMPDCWQKISNSTSYPQVYNYYANGCTGKCLYFYGGVDDSSEQIAILPPFSEATNSLFLTLNYSNSTEECDGWYSYTGEGYGQLEIGFITDPTDASTFTVQQALPKVSVYTPAGVALINAPAGSYVALRYAGGNSSSGAVFVDDIAISAIPSCLAPSGVSGSVTASDEISVSWTANGNEGAWKIQYSSDNGANWSSEIPAPTNPFTLTGLSANTDYIVQVKAVCGEEETSSWSASSATIHTPCGPVDASDYSENFENSATGSGKLPGCWEYNESVTLYSTIYPYVYNGSSYAYAGGKSLYFYGGVNESSEQSVILPAMNQALNGLTLEFYYQDAESPWGTLAQFTVGYIAADGTTFVPVDTLGYADSYIKYKKDLSAVPADAKNIAIRYAGGSGSAGYGYIDNVRVYPTPSCVEPTDVTVSNIGTTTADVEWTENGSASTWKLQISNDGSNWTDVEEGEGITANPYQLTGLTANQTTYYVRVKAVCGVGDESPWSEASDAFQTQCSSVAMPFSEDFNDLTTGIPACWDNAEGTTSTTSYKWNYTYNGHEGAGVQFDSYNNPEYRTSVLKTPAISISQAAILSFWYQNAAGGDLSVYYSIDGVKQDAALATGLIGQSDWKEHSVKLPATCVGHDVVIMFQGTSNYGYSNIYLDDIQVVAKPACMNVDASTLEASAITAHTATVSWDAGDEETAWNLQFKAEGEDWSDVIPVATTPSHDFDNLAANTVYYVRVQADCAGEGTSEYTDGTFFFATECEALSVAYGNEWEFGFEEEEGAAVNTVPACWKQQCSTDEVTYAYALVDNAGAKTGSQCLHIEVYHNYNAIAVLPTFSNDLKDLQISFAYKNEQTTTSYGQLEVGYYLNGTFSRIGDKLTRKTTYTDMKVEMPEDAPAGAKMAFRVVGSGGYRRTHAYIDDVVVSKKPIVLADNVNNADTLGKLNGKTVDVVIGRKIVRKGYYNTICLPFSLSAEEFAASPIATDDLWAFRYAKVDEATDELLFRIIESDHIEAGVPYFIGFEENEEDIINPLFKNVTISATEGEKIGDASVAQLCGIVEKPVVFNAGDQSKLFLAANNTLYWWAGDADSKLNNFRAYFKVATSGANGAPRHGMPARIVKEQNSTTGVDEINGQNAEAMKILENKQVVIIRNGVKYNVQGQVIR